MPSSPITPDRASTRAGVLVRIASATHRAWAPGMRSISRLNSLAWAFPCQRFTAALASDRA